MKNTGQQGFTLIELSIVLVVIGLVVGGVLVGRDLIKAAEVRATVTQLEQYNTAANTFYGKYGYLPGDIPAATAVQFGLSASVAARTDNYGAVLGNGDGILQNGNSPQAGMSDGGETVLFWFDLTAAQLIQETDIKSSGSCSVGLGACPVPARIGGGNSIIVFSGGYYSGGTSWNANNVNYFGLAANIMAANGNDSSNPGLTVAQAYAIDNKMDDGLPQSGRVIAAYINSNLSNGYGNDSGVGAAPIWVNPHGGSVVYYGITTSATSGSAATCYDNSSASSGTPGVASAKQHYSLEISNGSNVNCALSFQMQAGD